MFGRFKNPEKMTRDELESEWIRLRKQSLQFGRITYPDRMDEILSALVFFYLSKEKWLEYKDYLYKGLCGRSYERNYIQQYYQLSLDKMKRLPKEVMLYYSALSYFDSPILPRSSIEIIEILEYLIEEYDYPDAYFFYGITFKYGINPNIYSDLEKASEMFALAESKGYPNVHHEIKRLNEHAIYDAKEST